MLLFAHALGTKTGRPAGELAAELEVRGRDRRRERGLEAAILITKPVIFIGVGYSRLETAGEAGGW